jgi:hypothetical protein
MSLSQMPERLTQVSYLCVGKWLLAFVESRHQEKQDPQPSKGREGYFTLQI